MLFDYVGCGASGETPPSDIQKEVEENLRRSGWNERARCVVIDPELEVWVWSDSSEVGRCLGWEGTRQVQDWLRSTGRWPDDSSKPPVPKEAVEEALEEVGRPRSSSMFQELAKSVSLRRCEDEAFQRFQAILQEWFPPSWQQ